MFENLVYKLLTIARSLGNPAKLKRDKKITDGGKLIS